MSYTYNAQNKLIKGEKDNGESSSYKYNALGVRIENVQVRENKNAGYQNAPLATSSHGEAYLDYLKGTRATWQRVWETDVGTVVQNDFETVTRHYTVDYLSVANRDIMMTEDGSYTERYVYDGSGKRLSTELDYAEGTRRGEAGENFQSDFAADTGKVWYRSSLLNSTLFAVDADGEVIAHMIYDPWGNPLVESYTDANLAGLVNRNNYTGYTWDETLGLYFAQNRFYDAELHRFTQEDVIKDGWNWYAYCGNNPVVYVDMYGLVMVAQDYINSGSGVIGYTDTGTGNRSTTQTKPLTAQEIAAATGLVDNINTQQLKAAAQKKQREIEQELVAGTGLVANNINGNTMYIDNASFYSQWGLIHDYDTLLASLSQSVATYKTTFQTIATAPYHSNKEALDIVLSYNKQIECVAKKYSIDKAIIQSVLFQEIRFLNVLDEADVIVLQTYQYYHDLEDYSSWAWYTKLLLGPPTLPPFARTDTSTGPGQILASTAIEAYNWYYGETYDPNNWKDLEKVWTSLKYDNNYNIDMVGLVLAHKRSAISNPTAQKIMQAYNGTGNLAVKYGEVTNKYQNAFRQYNIEN